MSNVAELDAQQPKVVVKETSVAISAEKECSAVSINSVQSSSEQSNGKDSSSSASSSQNGHKPSGAAVSNKTASAAAEKDDTLEEAKWKPASNEALGWVHNQMTLGISPRDILGHLLDQSPQDIPDDLDNTAIWRIVVQLLTEPPRRKKLANFNTLEDAVTLIKNSRRIIVLTGAGISVSCGIPDFRSKDGIYARLHVDFPDLPCPQAMFDIDFFRKNPRPFYEFAKEIYPGQFTPSLTHKFIWMLEEDGKLLRNYTQNIDTLEDTAGIKNIIQCHGSFSHATCCECGYQCDAEYIREDIFASKIPRCPRCPPEAAFPVLKPDIVFFGESLPNTFHDAITEDKEHVDLLIVIGSSLKVRPVALIPSSIPAHVPQILISRDPLDHLELDVELLGNADVVVEELAVRLGEPYSSLVSSDKRPMQRIDELPAEHPTPQVDAEPVAKRAKVTDSDAAAASSSSSGQTAEADAGDVVEKTAGDCHERHSVDETHRSELNELRAMYQPRMRNVSTSLPTDTYYFMPPNRNVFPGAEVYMDRDFVAPTFDEEHKSSSGSESGSDNSDSSSSEADSTRSLQLTGSASTEAEQPTRAASCPPLHYRPPEPEPGTP